MHTCYCFSLAANSLKLAKCGYVADHYNSMSRPAFIRTHLPPTRNVKVMVFTHSRQELHAYAFRQKNFKHHLRIPTSYTKTQLASLGLALENLHLRHLIAYDMTTSWCKVAPILLAYTTVCPDALRIISLYCGVVCVEPQKRKKRRYKYADFSVPLSIEVPEWR